MFILFNVIFGELALNSWWAWACPSQQKKSWVIRLHEFELDVRVFQVFAPAAG